MRLNKADAEYSQLLLDISKGKYLVKDGILDGWKLITLRCQEALCLNNILLENVSIVYLLMQFRNPIGISPLVIDYSWILTIFELCQKLCFVTAKESISKG